MSLRGITKGSKMEESIAKLIKGEAMAAGMYFSLANVAREQGHEDVAEKLIEIATDEARHSGLYSFLNGELNGDIFDILEMFKKEEVNAVKDILNLSNVAKTEGFEEAGKLIEDAAKDEGKHARLLTEILEKYKK